MKLITNELLPVYETDIGEKVVDGRELHSFLEVGRDFASWMKDRIDKYGFTEGEEFSPVLVKTPEGGRPRTDYILKLDMAKEVAMVENNDKGSMARKYFIEVEKRYKSQIIDVTQLTPEMQMFKQLWDGIATMQIEDKRRDEKINLLEVGVTTIKETIVQRDDDWRESMKKIFNTAVKNSGKDYSTLRKESYEILEERAKCDLARRLRNMQSRLAEQGATKTRVANLNRLDVIEEDSKLKEIYSGIVKEISVRYVRLAN